MGMIVQSFTMTLGKPSETGNRRLREWWDAIPIVPIHVVDEVPNTDDETLAY